MDAPRNVWYAAAHADEIIDKPFARTVFGQKLVFFRTNSGGIGCLVDRCSHRLAPLSLGRIEGDLIRCGYHGALFSSDGTCQTEVRPGLEPSACSVRSFPTMERHGFVWVWMGNPALADNGESLPPFAELASRPNADVRNGAHISLKAPYSLIVDNLMDATHGQYVHATTLGCDGLQSVRDDRKEDFQVEVRDRSISFRVELMNGEAGRAFHRGLALKYGREEFDEPVDWVLTADWQVPSFHYFEASTRPAGSSDDDWMVMGTIHAITPETVDTCHYFFKQIELVKPGSESFNDFWSDATFQAFAEDKVMIEAQYSEMRGIRSAIGSRTWTMFLSDELSMAARGIIKGLVAAESATPVSQKDVA